MNLILIACCKTKEPGGNSEFHQEGRLSRVLNHSTYHRLITARRELADMLGLSPGPDLGFEVKEWDLQFMPAYQRYTGVVYQRSQLREHLPKTQDVELIIISALYGLLNARDYIRDYCLEMRDTLPNGQHLFTWWKQRGLGEILCEYARNLNPSFVHDLLSGVYRQALPSWPRCFDPSRVTIHTYPGEGTGSLYHRGDDLKRLLRELSNPTW